MVLVWYKCGVSAVLLTWRAAEQTTDVCDAKTVHDTMAIISRRKGLLQTKQNNYKLVLDWSAKIYTIVYHP